MATFLTGKFSTKSLKSDVVLYYVEKKHSKVVHFGILYGTELRKHEIKYVN